MAAWAPRPVPGGSSDRAVPDGLIRTTNIRNRPSNAGAFILSPLLLSFACFLTAGNAETAEILWWPLGGLCGQMLSPPGSQRPQRFYGHLPALFGGLCG